LLALLFALAAASSAARADGTGGTASTDGSGGTPSTGAAGGSTGRRVGAAIGLTLLQAALTGGFVVGSYYARDSGWGVATSVIGGAAGGMMAGGALVLAFA